ncbi:MULTISPECIES: M56 family metallopeptidase [Chryseobacterium]|uniref:Bla regulator protein BlaR1 n=1 Tax=Chryseobacterium camelliae TaxID=1265445 RepID=A0ABU0TMR9_9FLAO|nr:MULTISPECIES: M56 family metallopeptidase [Chryseobacterium]MDT3407801.1 bla regulator protein BlaR1 [Pseudacidovorax intermedius]MDQ1098344.1 bla regulator protein BlaR1 [Chryseobacterium camelliae]MDQ1102269.1 bla regulator protein BlaR1 [Chryseobacterium sp. SORGH_AS_1048]MDR6085707.1 bla regulator protein BlaR1 [Chryseobacterium sp. SORGH_AS_0909]MDR6130073.1 bla regulator protein BlaR1 [Chryseobacterium sp. SORGH_AS_1175]
MIILFKIILCSGLLIALYYGFLQKEKMYRFNRIYLLFSLLFSYTVPFISISTEAPKPVNHLQTTLETTQQILDLTPKQNDFDLINLIWILYGIITIIFLCRLIISFMKIKNLKGEKIIYQNLKVSVTEDEIQPFSFWNTIYLGKRYFINNQIDDRIFLHEKSHLEQKHSIDLIIIEIVKAFTWFNPAVYFYKNAILMNHEFLADDSVLENNFNVKDYQNLVLDEIISSQNYTLTNTFNFKNIKKRFIMMNTKKSIWTQVKKAISIPALVISFGLFVEKTYAHPIEKMIEKTQKKMSEPDYDPADQTKQNEGTESVKYDLSEASEIPEQLIENKKIQDTIRPKEGKSTNLNQETVSNSTNDPTQLPQFPGGPIELRNKVAKLLDPSKLEAEKGLSRADIMFTVTDAGNVVNVKVAGNNESFNNEALISFKKANENVTWKPAEKDGRPVNYAMRMPLTMSFE